MTTRRHFLALSGSLALAACASGPSLTSEYPPIVFVHGNGDSAALWQTTLWRFESNGWPRDRLFALDQPYPVARDDDRVEQPGRSSTAQSMEFLREEVERVLKATGARQVVLVANSRGGYAVRNYIQNGGGAAKVSHAVLGGVPNHGVWNVPGRLPGSEFAGNGPFLQALNAPKGAQGDEVTGPVKWLTIRSDHNDKFAQPLGMWIGDARLQTGITADGPALKGATNVVLPGVDHRETSFSAAAFEAAYRFITGKPPATLQIVPEGHVMLSGKVMGSGVSPTDPASGSFPNNLPLPGAKLEVYAIDPATGERRGPAVLTQTIGAEGAWGPLHGQPDTHYEFVVSAPGYATTHIYRSPFPRSSTIVHLRPDRVAPFERNAMVIVTFTRPRGYFDPQRDKMLFDRRTPPPGVQPGAGVSSSRIQLLDVGRPVLAEFNGEKLAGRTWPVANNELTVLELTY
ncbi:alpha/beta fold hydrolase [Ramlibacter alkalitolerans]|uniref:Twin-arginine translocation pathway signal n=1 Tax=Ramlibacter alkalitolerans TaxID=2039631 RepID=A0ABS1JWF8_9BURK|nr:alpha/beta fold hydrolase [Ramlibacter alkalitolerans]MBL0428650.1 twin-arginine translocation pathway signal [Ramlibacter alkalitolerans]